jgi:hypothetical protein
MPLSVPRQLGLGAALSVLASATAEAMQQGREGSGRLPDERFHTDNVFNSIAEYGRVTRCGGSASGALVAALGFCDLTGLGEL